MKEELGEGGEGLVAFLCSGNGYIVFWLSSIALYFVSLAATEQWQATKRKRQQDELYDRGFELFPYVESFVYITDGTGIVGGMYLLRELLLDNNRTSSSSSLAVKEALVYSAIGYLFSSSLHSVTLLPPTKQCAIGIPGFGRHVDKLMSNHTFHFGLFLRVLVITEEISIIWNVIPCMVLYSSMLLCTRGHYTVDIILAWWALGIVFYVN